MLQKQKLKTAKVIKLTRAFNELASAGEESGMPARLAYKLAIQISKLQVHAEAYQKQVDKLIMKHGEPVEGTQGQFNIKDREAYINDIESIDSIDVEVELLEEKIKLEDIEALKVKTTTIMALEDFIEA